MNLSLHRLSEKIRRGEPIPILVAAVLSAASRLTPIGMWLRMRTPPRSNSP